MNVPEKGRANWDKRKNYKPKTTMISNNRDKVSRTCNQLSTNSYHAHFMPLINTEDDAVNQALKENIMHGVNISDSGSIYLLNHMSPFSNLNVGIGDDIKLTLSPLYSERNEYWTLSISDVNIKQRRIFVKQTNNFDKLKSRERHIIKSLRLEKRCLPFSLEILPSVVMEFYKESLEASSRVYDVLFPSSSEKTAKGSKKEVTEFYDKNMGSNERQVQAIEHILGSSSYPFPYILFGPPGTGKSSTVAEAIKQIHFSPEPSRILVCAPSNVAVDVLAEKVLNHVDPSALLRIVSRRHEEKYRKIKGVFQEIIQIGATERFVLPWIIGRYKSSFMIFCTSVMGHVISKFSGKVFTHVIYDEAGFSNEPECLLAIQPHLESAFIVLSGDHNQLGPVVVSRNTPGLTISLMERLMTCDPLYNRGKTGKFRPEFVTKLIHNYRSDFRLLKLPSDLFYEGELIARALPCLAITRAREKMGFRFPFVFIDVQGTVNRPWKCTSFFNPMELDVVQRILNKLILFPQLHQMSFGVISPYRAQYMQCENAMDFCPRLEFGSPELFQGKEKDVILVTTARSSKGAKSIGFLDNFRRFNVAITRARYLCIVIGDASLLQKDPTWLALIQYTKENGGFISSKDTQTKDMNTLTETLENMSLK